MLICDSKIITLSFKLVCVLIAVFLSICCFYEYFLDNDVTLVDIKRFHENDEAVYPSVMLCFYNPFLKDSLQKYSPTINTTLYKRFLVGDYWAEEMNNVDYDKVTIDINKYFLGYDIMYTDTRPRRYCSNNKTIGKDGWTPPRVSLRTPSMKCFTVDIPFKSKTNIMQVGLKIKSDVLFLHL